MECGETDQSTTSKSLPGAADQGANLPAASMLPSPQPSPEISTEEKREEKAKRTKVHKREQELFGLVTPIFLPLLDASDNTKDREKKKRHKKKEGADASPPKRADLGSSGDAGKQDGKGSSSKCAMDMDTEIATSAEATDSQGNTTPDPANKAKRPVMKKSSLRNSSEKRRRKRVSIVIDGQTVLPADQIEESQLMSPSETTTSSASNSIASLEDTLDPRLRSPEESSFHSHNDLMHHNLNLPSHLPSASPTKHTGHTLTSSPDRSPMSESPPSSHAHLEYEPPQSTTRTYLDTSPPTDPTVIPRYASNAPIYAEAPESANDLEDDFSTYVGGISGSGIDDMDQAGSLGYPSSLGASYMESYMASRPLSVRMAAAERAGLGEDEKRRLLHGGNLRAASEETDDLDEKHAHSRRDDDDMEIMGGMEDF